MIARSCVKVPKHTLVVMHCVCAHSVHAQDLHYELWQYEVVQLASPVHHRTCSPLFRTYSRRILWEPFGSRDVPAALIWDVVKHKNMSRQARYIDNAPRPSGGTPDELIVDYRDNSSANILLHRYCVPSRLLYPGASLPLDLLKSLEWLKLTKEETRLAKEPGYVCVKGRSGTGKTLIAIHRMLLKARLAQQQKHILCQAYVARNSLLCRSIKQKFPPSLQRSSGAHADRPPAVAFFTMAQLVAHLEERAVNAPGQQELWQRDMHLRFPRFEIWYSQRPVPKTAAALTARQVWTEIQSIIQGTIVCMARTENGPWDVWTMLGA